MKAEIDEKGVLTVTAETPLERYALKQWSDSQLVVIKEGEGMMSTANILFVRV